ncbi:dicarboxylate/amino acid:cation symporter [Paraferrimonas haliotis]|uniref:Amino acid:proton symporter n=1 Tax=Paraferrimonas haliotis TaxID=2013866 RepID=A0AA37WWV0_9GAMM|nr:dicarboxylate/amino acid:cation symporter [Paraferrimonas haliotis]GLS82789.1 amino acid:proton symporter [Paraferrimonas haliotis]
MFEKIWKLPFWQKVLLGFALGVSAGVIFGEQATALKPLGDGFIALIKMLVAPLVFFAIAVSFTNLSNGSDIKRLGFKTVLMFMFTATVASVIGLSLGTWLDLGSTMQLEAAQVNERIIPSFSQIIIDMIPVNPIAALAEGKVLQIIVFAIFVGLSVNAIGEKGEPMKRFIQSGAEVMYQITRYVLKLTPIGVFGLMAWVVGAYGLETLLPLAKFIGAIYLACLIHILFVYGGLVKFVAKLNPITFFKKAFPAQIVAFTTASSYGTLPMSNKCVTEGMGVSKQYSSFVLPLGATMNMDGCGGIYPAIAAIFIAQLYGIDLAWTEYLLIMVTATVASIGTAGVPGSAMVMLTVTLNAVGLPLEGIAFIAAIDRIIDMIRTATNVTGDMMTAVVVGKSEGLVDVDVFNGDLLNQDGQGDIKQTHSQPQA